MNGINFGITLYAQFRPPVFNKHVLSLILCFTFIFANAENILGDVNNDEIVDVLDIIINVDMIMGQYSQPTEYQLWAADVNNDEIRDILDLVLSVNFILGNLHQECRQENGIFVPCYSDYTDCCYPITSSEFEWDVHFFGVYPGQDYRWINDIGDCVIVAEDKFYCVGEIHVDPTGEIPCRNLI